LNFFENIKDKYLKQQTSPTPKEEPK